MEDDVVDADRLAQFYARAINASSAMARETQKSVQKQAALRDAVGAATVARWYDEHQVACEQSKNAACAKVEGNEAARRGDWRAAREAYECCIALLPAESLPVDADLMASARANASLASLKLGQAEQARKHAEAAVAACPVWAKAHGRRGEALEALGHILDAQEAFDEAARLDPSLGGGARIGRNVALLRAVASAPPPIAIDVELSLEQRSLLEIFRSGCIVPADSAAIHHRQQLRLLEMRAVDSAIHAVSQRDYSMRMCACAGSRLWLLRKADELGMKVVGELLEGECSAAQWVGSVCRAWVRCASRHVHLHMCISLHMCIFTCAPLHAHLYMCTSPCASLHVHLAPLCAVHSFTVLRASA